MTRQIPEPLTYSKLINTRDYVLRTYAPDPINYEISAVSGGDYKTYYFVSFKYKHMVNVAGFLVDTNGNNISADQLSNTCLIDGRLYDNTYYRPYYINKKTSSSGRPIFSLYFNSNNKFTIDVKETYHYLSKDNFYFYYYYPSGELSKPIMLESGQEKELYANGFIVTDNGIYLADTNSITPYSNNSDTLVCLCLQYGEIVDTPPPADTET